MSRDHADLMKIAQDMAEKLQGQCLIDFTQLLEEIEPALTEEEERIVLARLDELCFRCEGCDWWCEIGEMSDTDFVCDDCEVDHG